MRQPNRGRADHGRPNRDPSDRARAHGRGRWRRVPQGLVALLSSLVLAWPAEAAERATVIKGIDVVGVPAAQVAELLGLLGLKEGMQVPYGRLEEAVIRPAEAKLAGTGRFRVVSVRPTTFIGGKEDGATYLTISVRDRAEPRLSKTSPQGPHALPPAVTAFFSERVRGLGAFRDTLLPSDQDRLEAVAEAHAFELEAALREAADAAVRARAAQAIAFHPDRLWARRLLKDSLLDPDAMVRRDAARALLPLLERQIGREAIALEPILALIRFPEPADRMNATSMLLRLARVPELRARILRDAGAPLLSMARMKHPGERTLALEALQVLKQAPAPESWESYRLFWESSTAKQFQE